jgi:hypothetical protein
MIASGSMAYPLIGGTAVGTVLILLFLPARYAAWFAIKSPGDVSAKPRCHCSASISVSRELTHDIRLPNHEPKMRRQT